MIMENIVWEKSSCPLCGDTQSSFLFRFSTGAFTLPVPSEIADISPGLVRCCNCSLVYLDHRPEKNSMDKIYMSDKYFNSIGDAGYTDYIKQEKSLGKTFSLFLATLVKFVIKAGEKPGKKIGSIVDIGCGNGYLLDRASGLFLFRAGSDMSKSAVKNASCVCDTVVRGGPDELLAQGLHGFDLLTLISVLEHIYNPVDFMNKCRMLVKKGGCIAVAVPCYGSFWRKIMGRRWISFKLPEHIAYYEKKSLQILGEKTGLRLVKFFPYHHFFPLSVILDKLGLHCSTVENSCLGNMNIFLPSVMLAAVFEN